MTEFCYNVMKRKVIQNEIMVFHKILQPIAQNPHPYIEEMWKKIKLQHNYSKVLFVLLERTIIDDFFKGRICMNSSKDSPLDEFNELFEQWISRSIDENPQMGPVCLESHYMMDLLLEFNNLKEVVDDSSRNVNFLNNKSIRTFSMFSTLNSLNENLDICFFRDWKNVLLSLLSTKVIFKVIVCICDHKSFNNLVVTLQEKVFKDNISVEYGFY